MNIDPGPLTYECEECWNEKDVYSKADYQECPDCGMMVCGECEPKHVCTAWAQSQKYGRE
jgi:hypothetical protein